MRKSVKSCLQGIRYRSSFSLINNLSPGKTNHNDWADSSAGALNAGLKGMVP